MIPVAEPHLGEAELQNVVEAVKSSWISSKGKFIGQFEEEFAAYCGVGHGVATSNGTTALHLALVALGIGPGDEVIVPTLTFIATANAVTYTGATPVFVDSAPDYWGMDPAAVEAAVTPRTKAVIPVHLYGHACDMDAVMDIAARHGLKVVEDAAEAHGATYKGRRVGSFGDIACFSFFGNKIITTGEGGMCLTRDADLAAKMRIFRDHGMDPQKSYWHNVVGFNYRMTNLQAAIGVAQLQQIDRAIARKKEIAAAYARGLASLVADGSVILHPQMSWADCVYWQYSLILGDSYGMGPDALRARLRETEIETRPLFYPVHTMPPYAAGASFPVAEQLSARGLSLPSGYSLTEEQLAYVSGEIVRAKGV